MNQGQMFSAAPHLVVGSLRIALAGMVGLLAACASPERPPVTREMVRAEIAQANAAMAQRVPAPISDALLAAPAAGSASAMPSAVSAPPPSEPRFDLIFNNANARDVFLALVSDTQRSMTLHPDVGGTISMTLRRVTLREALEAIREVYGYDFRFEGSRIAVFPPAPQTRVFTLNYLNVQRNGSSELRVSSGGVGDAATPTGTGSTGTAGMAGTAGSSYLPGGTPGSVRISARPSTQVATTTKSDLWSELAEAIKTIVGEKPGRHVLVTPQAGLIAVRAMPDELRQVESYLKSVRGAVERQVMLEAKIIDVELKDGFQSGVDWTKLFSDASGRKLAIGPQGGATGGALTADALGLRGLPAASSLSGALGLPAAGGGTFGLAIGTSKFEAVLGFLETFGDAQVLSSPRIATLNNQRALLKVGSDDYYITGISGGTTTTTTTGVPQTTLPNLNLTPFFSGISLDVTPQIDESNNVILHVHPSVSTVQERNRDINLGTVGSFTLPLASSNVNATDTIVRVQDGAIVAIGGLMQAESNNGYAGLPGTADKGFFNQVLGNQKRSSRKRELVILIKPTVIHSNEDWANASRDAQARLEQLDSQLREQPVRVIQVPPAKPATP